MGKEKKYLQADIKTFLAYKYAPFDLFYEFESGKKVKIASKGQEFNEELIEKCRQQKGEERLIFREEDFMEYANRAFDAKASNLVDSIYLSDAGPSTLKKHFQSIDLIRKSVKPLGVKEETIKLTDAVVASMIAQLNVGEHPLKKIFKELANRGDFFQQKALMICYFAYQAYGEEASEALISIAPAAFFHDFSVFDSQVIIDSQPEILSGHAPTKSLNNAFEEHMKFEHDYLSKQGGISAESVDLIKKHHLSVFSDEYSVQLSEMNSIFNFAHDFAIYVYMNGASKKKMKLFKEMSEIYLAANQKFLIERFSFAL